MLKDTSDASASSLYQVVINGDVYILYGNNLCPTNREDQYCGRRRGIRGSTIASGFTTDALSLSISVSLSIVTSSLHLKYGRVSHLLETLDLLNTLSSLDLTCKDSTAQELDHWMSIGTWSYGVD